MKTFTMTALAATVVAGTAFAHPDHEPHVCGIDPDTVLEYPGYAGVQGAYYDRGDYFFGFETVRFQEPVAYKHWSRVEAITTHHRLYKDDCRTTQIEIVHTETVDEVVDAGGNGSSSADNTYGLENATYDQYRLVYDSETRMFTAFFGHGDNIDSRTYPAGSNELGVGGWIETQYPSFHQATVDQEYWAGNSTTGTSNPIDFSDPAVNKDRWDASVDRYNKSSSK